jgi:hypothetical protein
MGEKTTMIPEERNNIVNILKTITNYVFDNKKDIKNIYSMMNILLCINLCLIACIVILTIKIF